MCFVFRVACVKIFFITLCVLFVSLLHDFRFSPPESPSQFQLYIHAYIYIKLGTKHICWSRGFNVVQCKGCDVLQEDTCSRVKYVNYVIWKMFLPIYSAEAFHRRRVQKDFFLKWKKMAADRVMIRAADNLHCLHSLKKGMNAFKWAINRSKIMVDIYQNKLKGILVSATFFKVSKSISPSIYSDSLYMYM